MRDSCYIITASEAKGMDVYTIKSDGVKNVLVFEEGEDAERYVIMLNEDDGYVVGETLDLEVFEVPLSAVVESLNEKGYSYIYIKPDDLFIPPDAKKL